MRFNKNTKGAFIRGGRITQTLSWETCDVGADRSTVHDARGVGRRLRVAANG
jgi:hypothetical protein